jgi:FtsZ-interacting cell division protein ZipA
VAAELRFILAFLSALLLAGIWWWGARRSRQAAGNAELRESTMSPPAAPVRKAAPIDDEPDLTEIRGREGPSEWGVSPLEPLHIRTGQFETIQVADLSITARTDPLDETLDLGMADDEPAARRIEPLPATGPEETAAGAAPAAPAAAAAPRPQIANASESQRIVSIRVCAQGQARWSGLDLMAALEHHGLAHGRYNVFHRKHSDGRTLFCAASLVEPGVFNLAKMPQEQYRGLTLFAVLPGPLPPLQTLDAVIETAGELAAALQGTIQDSHGVPLSMQGAEALREDVARFQARLSMT